MALVKVVPNGTTYIATAVVCDARRDRYGLDVSATVEGWPEAHAVAVAVREANKLAGR